MLTLLEQNIKRLFAIKSVSKLQKVKAIYSRINYLHATETSSSKSVSCIFGIVLLLEREPHRQTNADQNGK